MCIEKREPFVGSANTKIPHDLARPGLALAHDGIDALRADRIRDDTQARPTDGLELLAVADQANRHLHAGQPRFFDLIALSPDEPEPPLLRPEISLKSSDDGHSCSWRSRV